LFDQLNQLNLVEKKQITPTKFLIATVDVPVEKIFRIATITRTAGIPTEVYTKDDKFGKKLDYANKMGIPLVGIVGNDEFENDAVAVKDMKSGEQVRVGIDALADYLRGKVS